MALLVQTPLLASDAIELSGGTWRKRILPVGNVEYKGRVLRFDRPYLDGLAQAYNSRAYDQVPFQLADAANRHTNDPERTRGEVVGMSADADGLWVTIRTTEAGNAVLSANPRLGVSARIVEDYARSDGKYYPAAVQHVLGTLDPRIPELGDWQPVEMSNGYGGEADMVIDLSGSYWSSSPDDWDVVVSSLDLADDGGSPLGDRLRKLAGKLSDRGHGAAAGHVHRAADAADSGDTDGTLRHLDDAATALPSLDGNPMAEASMDDIVSHMAQAGANPNDLYPPHGADDLNISDPGPARPKSAAHMLAGDSGGLEFAGVNAALELAHRQAAERELEDASAARRLARRGTGTSITEDRLGAALGRIGRGTYTPSTGQRALGFASDAASMVDAAEQQAGGWDWSACTCTDDGVPAMTRYHTLGCPEAELTPDTMGAVRGHILRRAAAPAADANGNVFYNQYGLPSSMTELVQAHTGERLLNLRLDPNGDHPFEVMNERLTPQRAVRFGDPNEGDGQQMTDASADYVRSLAHTLGLAPHRTADQARDEGRQRLAWTGGRPPLGYRDWGDRNDRDPAVRARAMQTRGRQRGLEAVYAAGGPAAELSNDYDGGDEVHWAPSAAEAYGYVSR